MQRMLWVTIGLLISISLHLLVAWLWFRDDTDTGAPELGQQGMTITLADPGALAGDDVAEGEEDATPPEAEKQQEAETEPEEAVEPEPEAVAETAPETASEPDPRPEEAQVITPERALAAEQELAEPETIDPLPIPEVIAADGIVQLRKKRKTKPLPKPLKLRPLNQAGTIAVRMVKPLESLPEPEELRPVSEAQTKARRRLKPSAPLPKTQEKLEPINVANRLKPRQLTEQESRPDPIPERLEPLQVARPAPPPPPDRPRALSRPVAPAAKPSQPDAPPAENQVKIARTSDTGGAAANVSQSPGRESAKTTSVRAGRPGGTGRQQQSGEGGRSRASQGGTGSGQAARRGGSRPGAQADYLQTVRAWLEKHKRYPRRAKRRQQEGVARLRFIVDRSGMVMSYEILRGTGHAKLDDAVHDMIRRAQPLPAMPSDLAHKSLALTVPVAFTLR